MVREVLTKIEVQESVCVWRSLIKSIVEAGGPANVHLGPPVRSVLFYHVRKKLFSRTCKEIWAGREGACLRDARRRPCWVGANDSARFAHITKNIGSVFL